MSKYLLGGAWPRRMVAIAPATGAEAAPGPMRDAARAAWRGDAEAQPGYRPAHAWQHGDVFQKLDANRDGVITRAEGEAAKGERQSAWKDASNGAPIATGG